MAWVSTTFASENRRRSSWSARAAVAAAPVTPVIATAPSKIVSVLFTCVCPRLAQVPLIQLSQDASLYLTETVRGAYKFVMFERLRPPFQILGHLAFRRPT